MHLTEFQKHSLIFLVGCIGTRSSLAYLAYSKKNYLPFMGKIALLPTFGFLILYFFGLRKTGPESFNGVIWWNYLRPIHGILYLLFAYLAINKNENSWMVLSVDVLLGLFAWINKYFL